MESGSCRELGEERKIARSVGCGACFRVESGIVWRCVSQLSIARRLGVATDKGKGLFGQQFGKLLAMVTLLWRLRTVYHEEG